jgi:tetratricopeptide (TPR) repeat protein
MTSASKNLFDYGIQVSRARKEYEKILKNLQIVQIAGNATDWLEKNSQNDKSTPTQADLKNDFDAQLRQGLVAEAQDDFQQAFKIYQNIIDDANADEKHRAAASYQVGVCLLEQGYKEQATAQFEYILNNYPLQHAAVLKSVKMLRDIRSEKVNKKTQKQAQNPFVVNTIPELFAEDVDPNTSSITIVFSEPMEKADWFYSSFEPALLPRLAGRPSFDESGYEWTLPIKLKTGKVYAIAINCGDAAKGIENLQAGFRGVSGQRGENFILVFATANKQKLPTSIDEEIIERCEKINFKPEK